MAISKKDLHPTQVVLDLVLKHADGLNEGVGTVVITPDGQMVMHVENHLGQRFMFGLPVEFRGPSLDGETPRFVLRKLGPTVWKLAPSVLVDRLHAYITVVGVPDPAPWEVDALTHDLRSNNRER